MALMAKTLTQRGERRQTLLRAFPAEFLRTRALPPSVRSDAVHLAVAAVARADYLLTWNCRHLANAQILRRLEREAVQHGWTLPTVCTPLELMADSTHETESDS